MLRKRSFEKREYYKTGHLRSFGEKGRGLDAQDTSSSCALAYCKERFESFAATG